MKPNPPILILMAGMPGSGKSTVALALGEAFGYPVVDKDVIVSALLGQGLHEEIAHPVTYRATFDLVEHLLLIQRFSVVVDTPAVEPSTLDWAKDLCNRSGAILVPVLCSADGEVRFDRMAARQGLRSHSKGVSRRPGTARERFSHFPPETIELDTMQSRDQVNAVAFAAVTALLRGEQSLRHI